MLTVKARGLTSALYKTCQLVQDHGVKSECRGNTAGATVKQLSKPVCIEIENPRLRNVTLAERNWNSILPYAESIWLALGMNNLDDGPGRYVRNLYNFSDDGKTWRAGYGPRLRHFTGSYEQYNIGKDEIGEFITNGVGDPGIDQLKYVIESFLRDPKTRQADITISDPAKDCFIDGNLIQTKDTPCTRSMHFQKNPNTGALDMIVRMRSNDLIWGASAVNIPNFTLMQEYVALMLGVKIGTYFHIADNLHVYSRSNNMVEGILGYQEDYIDYMEAIQENMLLPNTDMKPLSLKHFDEYIKMIYEVDQFTFTGSWKLAEPVMTKLRKAPVLLHDWAAVIARHNLKKHKAFSDVKQGLYQYKSNYMLETIG